MEKLKSVAELDKMRKKLVAVRDPKRVSVRVCMTGCRAKGADKIVESLRHEISRFHLKDKVDVIETGCHGFCSMAPVMVVDPYDFLYCKVTPEDMHDVARITLKTGEVVERLTYQDPATGAHIHKNSDVPFYKNQQKIVLRNCGYIDPTDIGQYIARDGYAAIAKILSKGTKPDQVVEMIKQSGLRGRGGAGFPTGIKWQLALDQPNKPKYVICNADEGDPGAFMDRAVLEGDPHSVIEGMIIGAFAMGAELGYIYCRAEYPIAVRHIKIALKDAEEMGLLGDKILGSDFSFSIKIKEGAGAFVCGEETALMASIMGERGMPRPRPPFPIQSGLWNKPSCINNVETLANINPIILNGPEWYAAMGTATSKGTKIFALAGAINNTGLVEVPMGISLREIIFDVGGGIPEGKKFKAAQTGGPSGGVIPAEFIDLQIDYDSLAQVGAIMGSGGLIVIDQGNCIVDIAKFFLNFTCNESCGKCTPCRIGLTRMLEILNKISHGEGVPEDLDTLVKMATIIKDAALCGLGQTAPNPILTSIKHFREEYESHIIGKKCPALKCKSLITYSIDQEVCRMCGICRKSCPNEAITGEIKKKDQKGIPFEIIESNCIKCGMCYSVCPFGSVALA